LDNHIGDNIRRIRLARGLTQAQLGQKAGGRSVNQMNAYECGRSRPSPPIAAIIAEALGVPVGELTGTASGIGKTRLGQLMAELKKQAAADLDVPSSAVRVSVEIVN
jgi:transcriptional regulator with XRE-family HTH domain